MTKKTPDKKPLKKKTKTSQTLGKIRIQDGKKRTESSKKWLTRQLNDPFVLKAKIEGYRSRAAFKLLEINNKYQIIKPGYAVVDLGAAPGGWTQISVNCTKGKGLVVGVDLQEIEEVPGATLYQGDFMEDTTLEWLMSQLNGEKVHCVVSDMAAPACGMTDVDHIRIMNLVELVYDFSKQVLKPGGHMVAKVLRGGTENQLLAQLKKSFTKVVHFKPESSRRDSAEMYLIAMGYRD
jgi:23S rRNA (uridine2552-2'-O)-methyltransferase